MSASKSTSARKALSVAAVPVPSHDEEEEEQEEATQSPPVEGEEVEEEESGDVDAGEAPVEEAAAETEPADAGAGADNDGFETVKASKPRREKEERPPRVNVAVFATDSTGKAHALLTILELVPNRESKDRRDKIAMGALPGDVGLSIEDARAIVRSYVPGAVAKFSSSTFEVVDRVGRQQHYIIAQVPCTVDGMLPELDRPRYPPQVDEDGYERKAKPWPEARWNTWAFVDENCCAEKRVVMDSLSFLCRAIGWLKGKVPHLVESWVNATRPPRVKGAHASKDSWTARAAGASQKAAPAAPAAPAAAPRPAAPAAKGKAAAKK